eukprot:2498103-Prymnesium_polylepis.1
MDDLQVLCSSTAPPSALPGMQAPLPPPMAPPPPPTTPQDCTEQCYHSSDGDCDDGGPSSEYGLCQYGSDCTDCGGRHP